jgi:hypothetical protein
VWWYSGDKYVDLVVISLTNWWGSSDDLVGITGGIVAVSMLI